MTFLVVLYFIIVLVVSIRIVWSTTTPSKGLAYLLLVITFPIIGILFYLSVGLETAEKGTTTGKFTITLADQPAAPETISKGKKEE